MTDQRSQVLSLMTAWGYRPETIGDIRPILDVFRVETPDGPMNLKWTRHPDEKLLFILSALRYVWENGFHSIRLPLPTADGAPFLVRDGQHYLLSAWIEGTEVDLAVDTHLAGACQTLARFHRASLGYRPPPGLVVRERWGQMLESFASRCSELERFPKQAQAHRDPTGFDREIWRETDYYLGLATLARELLARSSYRELAARARIRGSLCHGDVAARNFILTPHAEVGLIDFDGLRQDLPLMDLWKLFRRTMKTFHWDVGFGLRILEAYESILPLSPAELEVLLALTAFPQKFWRLANRYYGGRDRIEEERFQRKLLKFTDERRAHAAFLGRLAGLCRERGLNSNRPPYPFSFERICGG